MIRETREETAWEFQPTAMIGMYLWRNPRTALYTLRFVFTGEVLNHDPAQSLDRPIIVAHTTLQVIGTTPANQHIVPRESRDPIHNVRAGNGIVAVSPGQIKPTLNKLVVR